MKNAKKRLPRTMSTDRRMELRDRYEGLKHFIDLQEAEPVNVQHDFEAMLAPEGER
jgi:hypothetical protein